MEVQGFSKERVKQTYFLVSITVLACVLCYWLRDYISSFLGAATLYILLRKFYFKMTEVRKWNRSLSIMLLMLWSVVVLLLPIALLSVMLSSKAQYMVHHYSDFIQMLKNWNNELLPYTGIDMLSDDTIKQITAAGANVIPGFLSGTVSSLTQIAVMYFLLYFMLSDGRAMERKVRELSPFKRDNTGLLITELKTQTISNVVGIPIMIVVQGVCSGIGYWIFGLEQPLFWAVITGFASVIPLVGTGIIWLPVSIYMYITGAHWQGICVGVYSLLVLTNIDNAVRLVVSKRIGDTHPLITFFGIVIGLDLFGFLGLIFGPLLISYFLILLDIYQREYLDEKVPEIILIEPVQERQVILDEKPPKLI